MGTYCGKTCETCQWREAHQCPGCQSGPGKPYGGDCEIAKCCREKGHSTCDTCTIGQSSCYKRSGREKAPAVRQELLERKAARQAEIAAQAGVLGKWLWVMFWLIIPGTVASLMTADIVVEALPGLRLPGEVLNAVCSAVYGFALLRLKGVREQYGTAGLWAMVGAVVALVLAFIPTTDTVAGLALLLSLPAIVIGLWGEYNEYMAHAGVLRGADDALSGKWETLWKWYIGLLLGLLGCLLLVLLAPMLGALAMIAVAIGTAVVGILKLVYLYRTAKVFRNYRA